MRFDLPTFKWWVACKIDMLDRNHVLCCHSKYFVWFLDQKGGNNFKIEKLLLKQT